MAGCITHLGHATCLIELDRAKILTDPLLRPNLLTLKRICPAVDPADLPPLDLVLVSHLHHDHCDPATLRRLPGRPEIVAPHGARDFLQRHRLDHVTEVGPGTTIARAGVALSALRVDHSGERLPLGPHAPALAFEISGSRRIYFAGDTGYFAPMRTDPADLDVALLPVSGWGARLGAGHLDPQSAARAAAQLRPRFAVPIHWGAYRQYWTRRKGRGSRRENPAREFSIALSQLDPGVEVVVLSPGSATRLEF